MSGSAITYLGLAGCALGHALAGIGDSEGPGEKGLAQWVMSQPFGSYIAIIIGFGLIIGGVVTSAKGLTRKFEKYLRLPDAKGVISPCEAAAALIINEWSEKLIPRGLDRSNLGRSERESIEPMNALRASRAPTPHRRCRAREMDLQSDVRARSGHRRCLNRS